MITFYSGIDTYRLRLAVTHLIQGRQTVFVDLATDAGFVELEHALKYPSFFQEPRFVIIRNAFIRAQSAQSTYDLLTHYDASKTSDITVVVCHEGPTGRTSATASMLHAYLDHHAQSSATFELLTGTEQTHWIEQFCNDRACTITKSLATSLAIRVGQDSWQLANELEKICAYTGRGAVSAASIDLLVPPQQIHDEFALSNALTTKNKRVALTTLYRRLAAGTAEQLLLGSVAHAIRTLIAVQDLAAQRIPAAAIARTIELPPFIVTQTLKGAQAYSPDTLQQAHTAIATLDRKSKDGLADIRDGLFSLVLAL